MTPEVVKEIFPFRRAPPPLLFADTVKIDRESGDQIEFATEVGQRLEGSDWPDPALDMKELQQLGEERELIDVETEAGVSEVLDNKEEESAATAEIKHRLRPATMQLQVLRANDV